jgi:D-alanine-D-alanine ligase
MVYTPQPGVHWPIVSYASKWEPGSAEDLAMQPRCPAQIGDELKERLQSIALSAFKLIGCRDVARIDFRLDAAGQPNVLEVNPNPDLGSSAGLARMLRVAGISYGQFIDQLVRNHLTS